MTTLIFEGIATSGKSTIIKHLESALRNKSKIKLVREDETHIPIMKHPGELHVEYFLDVVNRSINDSPDVLIFDRLYLTQAFRAKSKLSSYQIVEHILKPLNPTTIFLKVRPSAISDRVKQAALKRDPEWAEYIKTKGKDPQTQANYYIDQQAKLLKLLENSKIPYTITDTTDHNYAEIAQKLFHKINR